MQPSKKKVCADTQPTATVDEIELLKSRGISFQFVIQSGRYLYNEHICVYRKRSGPDWRVSQPIWKLVSVHILI